MRARPLALTATAALAAAAVVASVLFPLSLAMTLADVPIEGRPSGRVWSGRIDGASVRGIDLGTLRLRPRLLPLLAGRLDAEVSLDGPAGEAAGTVTAVGETLTVRDWNGRVALATLDAVDPFGHPLRGTAVIAASDAVLTARGCQSGTVSVTTDALRRAAEASSGLLPAPALSGSGTCRNGVLSLPLKGEAPEGVVTADLRLSADGYVAEFTVVPRDRRSGPLLARYGFQRTPAGYSFIVQGGY